MEAKSFSQSKSVNVHNIQMLGRQGILEINSTAAHAIANMALQYGWRPTVITDDSSSCWYRVIRHVLGQQASGTRMYIEENAKNFIAAIKRVTKAYNEDMIGDRVFNLMTDYGRIKIDDDIYLDCLFFDECKKAIAFCKRGPAWVFIQLDIDEDKHES